MNVLCKWGKLPSYRKHSRSTFSCTVNDCHYSHLDVRDGDTGIHSDKICPLMYICIVVYTCKLGWECCRWWDGKAKFQLKGRLGCSISWRYLWLKRVLHTSYTEAMCSVQRVSTGFRTVKWKTRMLLFHDLQLCRRTIDNEEFLCCDLEWRFHSLPTRSLSALPTESK